LIKDLQKFGEWLYINNQVSFGKNVDEEDYILEVSYDGNNFKLGSINVNKDKNYNYFKYSCFYEDFYHATDQKLIIPSKRNLLGFTPFFIKLDHDFIKNNELNQNAIEKFTNKIERSIQANSNNKEFSNIVNLYYDDFEEKYLNEIPFNENQKKHFLDFYEKILKKEIINLIIKYYKFILEEYDEIIFKINEFKESEKYSKKGNFFLACIFGDLRDLCNDFFYYYSTFLQLTSQKIDDYEQGFCSICGNKCITYPPLPYYAIDSISSFNYSANMKNSKLRICKNCSTFIKYSEDKLSKIINVPSILIIPKIKHNSDYSTFLKISNKDIDSFTKINTFLNECSEYNFDLLIIDYDKTKGIRRIKKYIENYKAFLVRFEKLYLFNENKMNYLFDQIINKDSISKSKIKNTFDFEEIFKEFFWEIDNEGIKKYPKLYHFYNIYTTDLTGNKGIFNNFTSKTVSIFSKYCENIFSFIYEINLSTLNKNMLNEIVLNSLENFQKVSIGGKNYKIDILKRLNSYFMLKKEILGDNMLKNENVIKLKQVFGKPHLDGHVYFEKDDKKVIKDLIKDDIALKYYLIGQFISYIDIFKSKNDKNKEVFSNFITNVNRNNIRKLFISEILQKNNFYIEKMNKKGKFLFEVFEIEISNLFNEGIDFDYEDYLLLIFTGYYTDNILLSKYSYEVE